MDATHPAFSVVLALAVGVLVQSIARHLRVPGIVLLLLAGTSLGPDGLGWVHPRSLGDGLYYIVHLAVAVILFEGGLNLEISRLRREQASIRRLVTWGAMLTLVGAALTVYALLGVSPVWSLLFGSLVVVTGPTVVGPLIQDLRLKPRVGTVLEAEGVLIDPIGVILAVLVLEIALAPGTESVASEMTALLVRVGFGIGVGIAAGFTIAGLLRARRLLPEGFENIFVLASVLLLYQGSDELVSHSGIMAVTVAGIVVGNLRSHVDRDLREFKDQLTIMLIGLLFVLLAADVRIDDVRALGWNGLGVVAVLVFVIRPIVVWICTAGTDLTIRERAFAASVAPRGIVAAAIASVTASSLETAGIPGAVELRALVFLTIGATVLQAGLTAGPIGSLLGVRLPGRDNIAILGIHGLGLALANELRKSGQSVTFLDSNPRNCRLAEEEGFQVVFGDALQERTLTRARFESVGTVIGMTPNQVLNSVFASRAAERFQVPTAYIATIQMSMGLAPTLVEDAKARILFESSHDLERWDVRVRHGSVDIEQWEFHGVPDGDPGDEPSPPTPSGELFVILTIARNQRSFPMDANFKLAKGDIASVAVHTIELNEAHRVLRSWGYRPHVAAEEPESAD